MSSSRDGSIKQGGFEQPDHLKRLFAAAARASSLGIVVLDSQTRICSINTSLAREMRIEANDAIGRTSHELVGDVVLPMEKVHERVLSLAQPESLSIKGRVRNTPEFGCWLNHCFPVKDSSGRVQQIGVFGVNVTAERASVELFQTLANEPKVRMAEAAGLLGKFEESIRHYHGSLNESFAELACPFTENSRKVDHFRSCILRLDEEIGLMRELIYTVISQFSIAEC